MKPFISALGIAASALLLAAVAFGGHEHGPDGVLGTWQIEKDGKPHHRIEITKCENLYCGRIVWLSANAKENKSRLDGKNRDHSLRKRPLLGLQVLSGYVYEQENIWSGGKLYAFEKGRTVSPDLKLVDANHLEVSVSFLLFNKTFVWERLNAADPSAPPNRPEP